MTRPVAVVAGTLIAVQIAACSATSGGTHRESPVERYEIAPAVLAELPTSAAELWRKDQTPERCTGPTLYDFLRSVGAVPQAGKPDLMAAVVVEASDGYQILLSMGEVDTVLRKDAPVLATQCSGTALGPERGPVLLLVPGDQRGSRRVRHVEAIRLAHP